VVVSASGPNAPAEPGAVCTVRIEPQSSRTSCHVDATCRGRRIYGGPRTGYLSCTMTPNASGGVDFAGQDTNGTGGAPNSRDPRLDLNTAAQQVTVSDDAAGGTWTVMIRFTGPAQ
jgi:hypothetical protein